MSKVRGSTIALLTTAFLVAQIFGGVRLDAVAEYCGDGRAPLGEDSEDSDSPSKQESAGIVRRALKEKRLPIGERAPVVFSAAGPSSDGWFHARKVDSRPDRIAQGVVAPLYLTKRSLLV